MKQLGLGLNLSTKKMRKREFLKEMERVGPGNVGRSRAVLPEGEDRPPPFGIQTMLRIQYLQQWFGRPTRRWQKRAGVPLYRSSPSSMRRGRLPDVPHPDLPPTGGAASLGVDMMGRQRCAAQCLMLRSGTAVDATLSLRRADQERRRRARPGDEADQEGKQVLRDEGTSCGHAIGVGARGNHRRPMSRLNGGHFFTQAQAARAQSFIEPDFVPSWWRR